MIEIRKVDEYPKEIFDKLVKENLEDHQVFIRTWEYYNKTDKDFATMARKISLGAYDGDELIGLSWGQSENASRFGMFMSLVIPEYRGQGIYLKLLERMLEETKDYDEIISFHHLINNRVISIKLKHEFYITGIDWKLMMGPTVQLTRFNNPKLFQMHKFRMGQIEKSELDKIL